MNCTYASRSTFCRICQDCFGKNKMRLQLVEPALMVKRYNSGRKRTISDVKHYKRDWFKRHKRVFLERIRYSSRGLVWNWRQDWWRFQRQGFCCTFLCVFECCQSKIGRKIRIYIQPGPKKTILIPSVATL